MIPTQTSSPRSHCINSVHFKHIHRTPITPQRLFWPPFRRYTLGFRFICCMGKRSRLSYSIQRHSVKQKNVYRRVYFSQWAPMGDGYRYVVSITPLMDAA